MPGPSLVEQARGLTPEQRNAFLAAWLGWAMDAFDFFLVVFVFTAIGREFGVSSKTTALLTTVTLIARPIGALLFGIWADKVGRRIPLMVDVLFYSAMEVLSGLAPSFTVLLVLRFLFGLGMGGEWGLGASLALEKIPPEKRGFWSGLLQQGYPVGYLLATLANFAITPYLGWRWLFVLGAIPALIAFLIRTRVGESEAWERTQEKVELTKVGPRQVFLQPKVLLRFFYLIVLMTMFNCMSHGTQDYTPTYLQKGVHLGTGTITIIAVIYNIGAIIGGAYFGAVSERHGRRRTAAFCALLGIPMAFLFAYSTALGLLALGAFLLQLLVQGGWGVIPAHLAELSPDEIRGFYPGVTYQLGNAVASFLLPLQVAIGGEDAENGSFALAVTIVPILVLTAVVLLLGPEAKGAVFGQAREPEPSGGSPPS